MKYPTAALLLAAGLAAAPVAQAQTSQHVLLIGMDGVRPDALDTLLAQNRAPNIQALIDNGLYTNRATTSDLTGSTTGWADVLRGVHRDEHRADHSPNSFASSPDIITRLENYDSTINTASFIGSWQPLHNVLPSADVREVRDFSSSPFAGSGDAEITTAASTYLASGANNPDFMFFYLADADYSGHGWVTGVGGGGNFDPNNATYLNQLELNDTRVGQLMTAIQSRPNYANEDWQIIVTSDHGGRNGIHGHNDSTDRYVPFIVSGSGVANQTPGSNPMFVDPKNIDIAPTALSHLGIDAGSSAWSGLRGHVVGESASVQPALTVGTNLIFNGDAEYDRGFNGHDGGLGSVSGAGEYWDQDVSGWDDAPGRASTTVMLYGSSGGFPTAGSAGPADRGDNFFSSGIDGFSTMTQRIDVSSIADIIDDDGVAFDLSAWLGGYASQEDTADFTARFLAANGTTVLDTITLSGPGAGERGNTTALVFRESEGDIDSGTRFIEFELTARGGNGNDGYADNLGFKIRYHGDLNGDGFVGAQDLDILLANWGENVTAGSLIDGDANGDGVINNADLQIVRNHWGNGTPAGSNVPEPGSLALIALGVLALTRRRRR